MPKSSHGWPIIALVLCLGGLDSFADALDNWHLRSPQLTLHTLHAVAYGNNTFVAGGGIGMVLTSPDGMEWALQSLPTPNVPYAIIYAEDRFIAATDRGSQGAFLSSVDGTNWAVTQSFVGGVRSLTYGRGLFLAGGKSGELYRSNDGTNWIKAPSTGVGGFDIMVRFVGDYFIMGGGFFLGATPLDARYSSDGTNWLRTSNPVVADSVNPGYAVTFGKGLFVSGQRTDKVIRSTSVDRWTAFPTGLPYGIVVDLTFDRGMFVGVGGTTRSIITSVDGTNWSSRAAGVNDSLLYGITSGKGRWVAVGDFGMLLSSEDANTWAVRTKGVTEKSLLSVSGSEDGLVTVGVDGVLSRSTNGIDWTRVESGTTNSLRFASKQNGLYLVGGTNGILRVGAELEALQTRDSQTTNSLLNSAFGHDRHVIVGGNGTILTSVNGVTWSPMRPDVTNDLAGICFADGAFVAVGGSNTILRSTDGLSWERRPFPTPAPADLLDVVHGNGRFIAVSSAIGILVISTNGLDWSIVPNAPATVYSSIAFGGGFFALTSLTGSIRTSRDGLVWTRRETGYSSALVNGFSTPLPLYGIAHHNGTFVVVGRGGAILQSDPAVLLNLSRDALAELEVLGPSQGAFQIEACSALNESLTWLPLVVLSNAPVSWTDPDSKSERSRLYRARLLK